MRYANACSSCGQHVALATLTATRDGLVCATGCTPRGSLADFAPAAQRARDDIRDWNVASITGPPIPQATRTTLNTWRAGVARQKHGGTSW